MGSRSLAAFCQLSVPCGTKKNDYRGKLHPDDQADHGSQASIHYAVGDAAHILSKEHVHQPPKQRRDHCPRQYIAHAVLLGTRDAIDHCQRQHSEQECGGGEKDIPPSLQNGVLTSFITWEPASSVPVQPSAAIFQASGPRFTRNSETIAWLPGGKNWVRSAIRSNRLVLPPRRLVASATAISKAGKKARKRLKAMACEIMLHCGKTRANIP